MIKVTVAEVQRDVIKQLGVDLSGSFNIGTAVVNFNQTNPFSAFGQSLSGSSVAAVTFRNVTATLKAMERAGVVRTLAEPNVTVVSGETGLFVAGGEFPVPNGLVLRHHQIAAGLPTADRLQEIRRQPRLHAGRSGRGPHQPEGRHRGLRPLERERDHARRARHQPDADHPLDPRAPRRDRGRNPVRRLARDGRHDPGTDQAADQRLSRPAAAADPRRAVQEPRLHQQADRADDPRDALCGARGGAEGSVAAGRRLRRRVRFIHRAARAA